MFRYFSLLFVCLISINLSAQITTDPQLPVASKAVTITFNSAEESNLGYFTGDLYAHTGLITGQSTSSEDWKYVIESWGNNTTQPKLTNKGNGIYELLISPDISSFYAVPDSEKIVSIAFVFRSSDGNQQTNNLYVSVYEEGLVVDITEPETNSIFGISDTLTVSASASLEATLKLFVNDSLLNETTGTTISAQYSFNESGTYWLIAEATADSSVRDSVSISVRPAIVEETKPEFYKKGINYTGDNSAALVLWAPLKEFVYVVGDFNNWQISNDYLMKQDGDYFWIDISGLEKGEEYAFQYLIDGSIKVADPYTEKILDPWNDSYISDDTYPNLKSYPDGETEGIVSVLQTGQEQYSWEVNDFEMPEKEKLVIYEMLIRDFTEEHTYASIIDKLDYLEDLRINVLELMPVNEFEGNSSWGYNPSFYFAPDKYYGPKNELKKLIDECHKRGIAVVIDMVLNHSYGQSPFALMYMDNWVITDENPWYNVESPNTSYSWGYDFNHEADATKELVDSVNSFWINEYKVDGFRFDFTKGFTNTVGDGSAYDQSRINILKRMSDEIWERNPEALVILEHLAGNTEETILANYGMMLWGNMNSSYGQTAMGYTESLYWGVYSNRGWAQPNLVTYMESHDEERLMYNCLNSGNSSGDYSIKDFSVALDRIALNSVFFLPLPGPKMIWQFEELGYDYSINTCEDGTTISNDCRTSPKPLPWNYLEDTERTDLFQTIAKLNELKQNYNEFSPDNAEYSLAGITKWYKLSNGSNYVIGIGNFDVALNDISVTFPVVGKYYEFFTQDSIEISTNSQTIALEAGEYRLYSTRLFNDPRVITDIKEVTLEEQDVLIYPNPVSTVVNFQANSEILKIEIYTLAGNLLIQKMPLSFQSTVNLKDFASGIYLTKIYFQNSSVSKKIVVK
jgi:glycosidase